MRPSLFVMTRSPGKGKTTAAGGGLLSVQGANAILLLSLASRVIDSVSGRLRGHLESLSLLYARVT